MEHQTISTGNIFNFSRIILSRIFKFGEHSPTAKTPPDPTDEDKTSFVTTYSVLTEANFSFKVVDHIVVPQALKYQIPSLS